MSKIKILSPQEICKIAAGEVVERPANIVKELVENALDANSTHIEIFIDQAGKKAIRILDNGFGMSKTDALLCFAHHATSKIKEVADLDHLSSFGFRGEALSSIAAVSKVTLITMEKGAICGTQVNLEGGRTVSQNEIASPIGTDISINDLFYNVPARQKFLKKDDTEWRQILLLFQAFVFDYPEVHFKLYSDGRLVHNCPPVQHVKERILQLFDPNTANQMLELASNEQSGLKISGISSNHQIFRYNRSHIFCFVNRRLVKNHGLIKAILKGYANVLPQGRYPVAVLFIDLPATQVDINVHPRKEEVSFLNVRKVESAVALVIKKALEDQITNKIMGPKSFNQPTFEPVYTPKYNRFKVAQPINNFDLDLFKDYESTGFNSKINETNVSFDQNENVILLEKQSEAAIFAQNSFVDRNYEIIGQFKKTYIIISNEEGLMLVDQHAAHERVLYEKFRNKFVDVVTVNLMFPQIIMLSSNDLETLKPHLTLLKQHGILAEIFGADQIIIQAIPTYLKQTKLDELIYQLIAWLNEYQELDMLQFTQKINEHLHAQMACKAAVKAGDFLSNEQMYELLDDLEKTNNRLTCPHGRPTVWSFTLNEIEKKFKRKL